jgi:hypothetical protein
MSKELTFIGSDDKRAAPNVEPQFESYLGWVFSQDAVGWRFGRTKKVAAAGAPLNWWMSVAFARTNDSLTVSEFSKLLLRSGSA